MNRKEGNFAGWEFTELDPITMDNVAGLRPVWSFATGVNGGHDSPPIGNDGIMYVTTPGNYLYDLDAPIGVSTGHASRRSQRRRSGW